MILFNRSRSCTARLMNSDTLLISSALLDSVHEMELTLHISLKDYTVSNVHFEMKRAPYTFCFEVLDKAEELKGFNVLRGSPGKKIYQLLSGEDGCLQLADLASEGMKIFNQSLVSILPGGRKEMLKKFDLMLQGTCHSHSRTAEEKIKAAYSLVTGQLSQE